MAADLRLFDERTGRYVDALYAVLVASDEMQFFPEMVDIFGDKEVVKFLDIFAGQTITIPPRDVLELKLRDVSMWLEFSSGGESVIPTLAKEHSLAEDTVRERIKGIEDCMNQVGVTTTCKSVKSAEKSSAH